MEKICIVKRRREYAQPEVKFKVTQPEISENNTPEVTVSSVTIENTTIELADKKIPEVKFTVTQPDLGKTIKTESVQISPSADNKIEPGKKVVEEFVDKSSSVISIVMTKEQSDLLQQSEYIKELLSGDKNDPALDIKLNPDGRISLNYRFNDSLLIRMLSSNQVCQMLQISRSFLQKLIHEKKISSYKLGRMRRFLLEDVLEYLSNDAEFAHMKNEK